MASLIKTAAVAVAMKKCPFLSAETLAFVRNSSTLGSIFAKKCPIMGQFLSKGVATLPVPENFTGETPDPPAAESKELPTTTALPEQYDEVLKQKIVDKKEDSTYRTFRVLSRDAGNAPFAAARTDNSDSETVSVWCSNDYLGMSSHPEVTGAVIETIEKHGVGAGGTRSIAGTSHYHVNLENRLASLHGMEAGLVFTSCYVANDTALQTLARQLDAEIYSDAGNHASMIAGINNSRQPKFVFRHNDVGHLEELLQRGDPTRLKIIAFESVYSMTGTMSPISEICDVARKYNAITFVDEVHAVGLYGETGGGLAEEQGIAHKIDVVSGTLGKAYGLVGGYIASSDALVDVVRSYGSGLIFTTSIPPSTAAGAFASINVLAGSEGRELRARHRAAYSLLRKKLLDNGLPVLECPSHIVPVHVGDPHKATRCMEILLQEYRIYVQAINYPTVPRGSELLRFVATPYHSPEMMDYLMMALTDVWERLDLPKFS